jgi:hypothetical protein
MDKKKSVFDRLSAINVNEHVEKKDNLTYLSWAWAWSQTKRECPDATYKILETEYDEALGFMCHTNVTIEGETLEMWLPVMDGKTKSMKKYYTDQQQLGNLAFVMAKSIKEHGIKEKPFMRPAFAKGVESLKDWFK